MWEKVPEGRMRGESSALTPLSILPLDRALVPAVQTEPGDEGGEAEDGDAGAGEEDQRGEEARDVEPVLRLEQPEREARALAGRAGRAVEGRAAGAYSQFMPLLSAMRVQVRVPLPPGPFVWVSVWPL